MRLHCLLAALVTLFGLAVQGLNAQVTVTLHRPPPTQLHVEMLWRIDLVNPSERRLVRLFGRAFETRSRRMIGEGLSSAFELRPGFTAVNPAEISPIDYDADPEYDDVVTRTGRVPAGEYTICVYVIDEKTRDTLGRDCITEHVVLNVLPPQLIYPYDGSSVSEPLPVFSWSPLTPVVPEIDVTYRIRVVEMIGRQSPFAAMESNPSWFDEGELAQTMLPYPMSAERLVPGMTYAWQVLASVSDRKGGEGELARSEIWAFTVPTADEDLADKQSGDQNPPGDPKADLASSTSGGERKPESEEALDLDPLDLTDGGPVESYIAPETPSIAAADPKRKQIDSSSSTRMFAELKQKLDGGYYQAIGFVRFVYDNRYTQENITYRVFDDALKEVMPKPVVLSAEPGRNYYSVDLRREPSMSEGRFYTLVVTGSDGREQRLRFLYNHCEKCPDEPPIPSRPRPRPK